MSPRLPLRTRVGNFLSLWWCWFSLSNPQLLCPVPSFPCLEYNESHFLEYALGLTRFCPIQYRSLSFIQLIANVWSSLQEIPMYFALISNCLSLTIKVFLSKLNIWVKVGQDLRHYYLSPQEAFIRANSCDLVPVDGHFCPMEATKTFG